MSPGGRTTSLWAEQVRGPASGTHLTGRSFLRKNEARAHECELSSSPRPDGDAPHQCGLGPSRVST
jgi:hypothetical protein